MNFSNMMQLVNMVKSGNPETFVMNMLKEKAGNNPMFNGLIDSVQKGDTQAVENVVRNIAKEKGIDFDKEFNSFKQMFGL
jgi:hypothetical protein